MQIKTQYQSKPSKSITVDASDDAQILDALNTQIQHGVDTLRTRAIACTVIFNQSTGKLSVCEARDPDARDNTPPAPVGIGR